MLPENEYPKEFIPGTYTMVRESIAGDDHLQYTYFQDIYPGMTFSSAAEAAGFHIVTKQLNSDVYCGRGWGDFQKS